MRGKYRPHHILEVILLFIALAGSSVSNSKANENSKYLDAVREFADNVLKFGRDTYGPKHTPLFVDGLNIHTHEPVKWIDPDGTKWILSNLASQQTLMRTLDGLSEITGDPKYREAAMQAIRYAFDHVRTPSGLFYWGHITAYDALGDTPHGNTSRESIKLHYPYYELMWKVDPEATKKLIEALWCAHVIDWSNLDFDRGAPTTKDLEEPWEHEYKGGPTFFKSKVPWALANTLTGSSLIQAGTTLHRLSRQEQPLVWSKRLAKRFVDTRHPKTGISAFIYNNSWLQLGEDMKEHFVDPHSTFFPYNPFEFRCLYYPENAHVHPWMSIFLVGRMLGEQGREFTQWALEEFTAWGEVSYREKDNSFVPMLTDGTTLEGYVWKNGPGNSSGLNIIKPYPADLSFFWGYSVAYCTTGDKFIWQMVRDIAHGNGLGDIGRTPADTPKLETDSTCSSSYAIFGLLELYAKLKDPAYLQVARQIGNNILLNQFHKGFFVSSKKHIYTRFDCFEPLAFLHLESVMRQATQPIPQAWPSLPLFVPPYRSKQDGIDRRVIYALTDSPEPPLSLQETAAVGDVDLVRTLIATGTNVDSLDGSFFKTALHRAATGGHTSIAELLLAEGADVNARADGLVTPLHYASEEGHKEVVELLTAKGADVNAKSKAGDTPLHSAVRAGHKYVVELLIAKGADINAKNNQGQIPLQLAKEKGHKEIVELLRGRKAEKLSKGKARETERFSDVADLVITGEAENNRFGVNVSVGNLNGDGYNDLLVTAPGYNKIQGRAYLYYGGEKMDDKPDKIFTGENIGDGFSTGGGPSAYLADMNKDGFDDVIIGARKFNNSKGRVYIFYGGLNMDEKPDIIIEGHVTDSQFGHSIAVGDLNGDGELDLVIGANRFEAYRGRAYLYYGPIASDTTVDKIFTGEATDDTFAMTMTARGDVNGDGYDDLLVGTLYYPQNTRRGRAYLYYGCSGTDMDVIPDLIFDAESGRDNFAVGLDLFDIDNDGYADVLITARKWPSLGLQGRAYLYWGSNRATMDNVADKIFTGKAGVKSELGGNTIYVGHVNDDNYGDIYIAAYGYLNSDHRGRGYLYYGNTKASMDTVCDHTFTEGEVNSSYGKEAKLADLNGDSLDDVILGAWRYNNYRGRVYVYFNKPDSAKPLREAVTDADLE